MSIRYFFTNSLRKNFKNLIKMTREVANVYNGIEKREGEGVMITRSIGNSEGLADLDPFLLLDEFNGEGAKGFPDHPHRGFEAISYVLRGSVNHEDSTGHKGVINTGDSQWLTAGSGVLHCDTPVMDGSNKVRALQLWINLEKKNKMVKPKYQLIEENQFKKSSNGVHVKVIAGQSMGVKSTTETLTPAYYLDFKLEKLAEYTQEIPSEWNSFIYLLGGSGLFGKDKLVKANKGDTLVLTKGESITFKNEQDEILHFILLAGMPTNEPIARGGPFVMNTQQEIMQARSDFQLGKNGFEGAPTWMSTEMKRRKNLL